MNISMHLIKKNLYKMLVMQFCQMRLFSFNWQKKLRDEEENKWIINPTVIRRGEGLSFCDITDD